MRERMPEGRIDARVARAALAREFRRSGKQRRAKGLAPNAEVVGSADELFIGRLRVIANRANEERSASSRRCSACVDGR